MAFRRKRGWTRIPTQSIDAAAARIHPSAIPLLVLGVAAGSTFNTAFVSSGWGPNRPIAAQCKPETAYESLFGRIGATQNRLELVSEGLQDADVRLQKLLSEKIEADYADTVLRLNIAQNSYQAALNAAGERLGLPRGEWW